ncbi:MAG: hypothetical protein ACERKD_07120 [Prolixibacteraceae bacterium]
MQHKITPIIFLFTFTFFSINLLAGSGQLLGRVVDVNDAPISGASITLNGTTFIAISDSNGEFNLTVPFNSGSVLIRYLDCRNQIIPFQIIDGNSLNLGRIQMERVELAKNIIGVQLGLGANIYNELYLNERLVFRTQIEISPIYLRSVSGIKSYDDEGNLNSADFVTNMVLPQNFSMEFKGYFNIASRAGKYKRVKGNSANYFLLGVKYAPLYVGLNQDYLLSSYSSNDIYTEYYSNTSSVIYDFKGVLLAMSSLGMRRSFGNHFNFELNAGIGVNLNSFYSDPSMAKGNPENWQAIRFTSLQGVAFHASLCLGYDFVLVNR